MVFEFRYSTEIEKQLVIGKIQSVTTKMFYLTLTVFTLDNGTPFGVGATLPTLCVPFWWACIRSPDDIVLEHGTCGNRRPSRVMSAPKRHRGRADVFVVLPTILAPKFIQVNFTPCSCALKLLDECRP